MCQVKREAASCSLPWEVLSLRCWGSMTFNPLNLGTFHWSRFRLGFDVERTVCVCLCVARPSLR